MSADDAGKPTLEARLGALSPEKQALLAKKLAERAASRADGKIMRRTGDGPAPLTQSQELLWLYEQMTPGTSTYNIPLARRIRGPFDADILRRAMDVIIERHEALRTSFLEIDGEVRQVIDAARPIRLDVHDLRGSDNAQERAAVILREGAARPFDLALGITPRVILVEIAEHDTLLLIVLHHLVFDGGSVNVLFRELSEAYGALASGRAVSLPPLQIQFADLAEAERRELTDARLAPMLEYWRSILDDAPSTIELPADSVRSSSPTGPGARLATTLPAETRDALVSLAAAHDTTPFVALVAAFETLLFRYTHQRDFVIGTPLSGRARPGTEHLIGSLANVLPLRATFDDDPTFAELVARAKKSVLGAIDHAEVSYERLVREFRADRPTAEQALFQITLNWQDAGTGAGELPLGPATLESIGGVDIQTAKFELAVAVASVQNGLRVSAEYRSDLFSASTIERMVGHLRELIHSALRAPTEKASRLDILTAGEKHQLVVEFNDTKADWDKDATLHGLIEAQARIRPDAIAVKDERSSLTYAQLDARANAIAWALREHGVGPDTLVGVCMEKSADQVAVFIGILKAGGAYVPIDPVYPDDRVAFMLGDSAARVVVADASLRDRIVAFNVPVLVASEVEAAREEAPPSEAGPNNLCYVIYTSGSTGAPKGVLVEHRNIVRLLLNSRFPLDFNEHDIWTVFHSFSFDFSVWEMYGPLLYGGRLVVVPREVAQDPAVLIDLLVRENVTVLNQVTSAFYALIREELSRPEPLLKLRYAMFGGEPVQPSMLHEFKVRYPRIALVNMYGPAETSVLMTVNELGEREIAGGVNVLGGPMPTVTIHLLDEYLQLVPVGVAGELCIGGDCVARGYLNRADLTEEKFIPNPFRPGERMYRSGDFGRMRPNGEIESLGRRDTQVKLRGFRIELGEVEAAIAALPGVRAVAVDVRTIASQPALVGYVVAEAGARLAPREIRVALRERLPEYMVPAVIMPLDAIPVTTNGKTDRKALPTPTAVESPRESVAPRTPVEQAVAAAFAESLGLTRVGATDDFYELGGHSLLAIRIAATLREQFGNAVTIRFIFEHPRVDALAEAITQATGTSRTAEPIPAFDREPFRRGDTFVVPASFAQARLFFIEQMFPGRATYNVPIVARLRGALDVSALNSTLTALVARHEVLRTTFDNENATPVQVIHPPHTVAADEHDLDGAFEFAWAELLAEANRPFDLRNGPIIRASLYRIADDDHLLLIALHHIAADGWSLSVLLRDLSEGYAAALEKRAPDLPVLTHQYADYAMWQRSTLTGTPLRTLEDFWRKKLNGPLPAVELPMKGSRPLVVGDRPVGRVPIVVPGALAARLNALARRERATPFMLYVAAFQLLLSRYTGQNDVIVGTPMSGRDTPALDALVGLFLNTVVLRTDVSGNPSFRALLGRVRDETREAFAHDALPFERVIDVAKPPRNEAITPIFQIMFSLQNATTTANDVSANTMLAFPGVSVEPLRGALASTKFDFQLTLVPEGSSYRGTFDYDATLFDREMVQQLCNHYLNLLSGAAASPDDGVAAIELLDATERTKVLSAWNETAREYPREKDLLALFDEQVAHTPDATALTFEAESLTYRQLDERVGTLAAYLSARGVTREVVVALYVQRSAEMVISLLAILRAGGAYLPLDPDYPRERLEFMLADSGAAVMITQESLRDVIPAPRVLVVSLDSVSFRADLERSKGGAEASAPPAVADPNRLAYLIYTSGSTGKPKGVGVTHRNVVNFLAGFQANVPFGPENTLVAVTPLSFDIAGLEVFLPVTTGGRVVIASRDTAISAQSLALLLVQSNATHMQATPATWRMLIDGGWQGMKALTALCGGEALQPMLANAVLSRTAAMWNLYGPTEATIWATMHRVTANTDAADGRPMPIGKPMANYRVYILDAGGQLTPVGVPGELYIAGDGVARGYHNREDLTAQRFVPEPFAASPHARMYRTGDRARWRSDGVVEFLGRFDDQVKLRGFRIELGEIESVLAAEPSVQSAVVVVREDAPGDQRLVAYMVSPEPLPPAQQPEASALLRERLKHVLPTYMVANAFVWLDAWPLTPNGKLDRKALPAPDVGAAAAATPFQAPGNPVEELIAGVWREVLGHPNVGVTADFFDLGGHSLLAMQALSMLSRTFNRQLSLRTFFAHATIRGFADVLVAEEETPGRTHAVARAMIRLRDMSPEERKQRRAAAAQRSASASAEPTH